MFAKNVIVDKFANTKPEKEPESYLRNIKFVIIFNWLTGFFPETFDRNLFDVKFSWFSWNTVSSFLTIIILIGSYLFCYMSFIKQNLQRNASTSVVHKFMMEYEYVFASIPDLLISAFFPNLSKLVSMCQEMKINGRKTK